MIDAHEPSLTPSAILAEATQVLAEAGYTQVRLDATEWPATRGRLFEDLYGVVAVLVFDTWTELHSKWHQEEAELVEAMATAIGASDVKVWEGYLVLLTPSPLTDDERDLVQDVRYDTSRVRKLVATGEELSSLEDVRRALQPVLPVSDGEMTPDTTSVLGALPELLAPKVSPAAVAVVVDAFDRQDLLIDRLHEHLGKHAPDET